MFLHFLSSGASESNVTVHKQCHLLKQGRFLKLGMRISLAKTRFRLDSSLTVLNSLRNISSLSAEAFVQFSPEISAFQVKIYILSLSK